MVEVRLGQGRAAAPRLRRFFALRDPRRWSRPTHGL